MGFRVLTYNIRKGKGGFRGPVQVQEIAEKVATREPDLVMCQEVFHSSNGQGPAQSQDIGGHLDFRSVYEPNAVYRKGNHGNATLTHFEIRKHFNSNVSTNPIEKRGVLYSLIQTHNGPVHVFNTHLGLNKNQRVKQVLSIATLIDTVCKRDDAILLAGDFNDWNGVLDAYVRRHCGLNNALSVLHRPMRRSWPSARPVFALDRIYFRNLDLLGIRVLRHQPWDRLSDHLPVEAEFSHS